MARRKTETPVEIPETQAELDALTPEQAIAAAKAADDADLAKMLADRIKTIPPKQPTVEDNFLSSVNLIAQAAKTSRLPVPSLVKLYELNIYWALNTRNTPMAPPPDEGVGDEVVDLPTPNEIITGEPDEENTDG